MNHIKSLHIEGFKKFVRFDVLFNEHMNILVGENEAGKSTILESINIVLNQQYRNADKSILKDLLNERMVSSFSNEPSVRNLPYILIELQLELNHKGKNSEYFFGENNLARTASFGITFECRFDEELGSDLDEEINEGKIPYEYYALRWNTFAGLPYQPIKRSLNFLAIDPSSSDSNPSFNYFSRALFSSIYDERTRMGAKNSFRDRLSAAFAEVNLPAISAQRKFGINDKKVILESILSVYEGTIALENRGRGMEHLIKTQIALDRQRNNLDVILMEEPENHLCHSSLRKMLQEIASRQTGSQIIIATHSNMIASSLNLNNVLWITRDKAESLRCVDTEVANFFVKAADNSFLQLLLSNKVILVEGTTEYLLFPHIYTQVTRRTMEIDGISIISCNGISYKHYLEIGQAIGKKIAVLTDNDRNQGRIDDAIAYNTRNDKQHVFIGRDVADWTWEVCFYTLNRTKLDSMIHLQLGAKYPVRGIECDPVLGKMLNNKVDTAYQMLISNEIFEIPQYVKDAIAWLNE